jgi:hypothetical protein
MSIKIKLGAITNNSFDYIQIEVFTKNKKLERTENTQPVKYSRFKNIVFPFNLIQVTNCLSAGMLQTCP